MSARNYITSARDRNISKLIDYLPQINQQKCGYRPGQELPALSANAGCLMNRNLLFSYNIPSYTADSLERASTPFSDFFSGSETGTPDFNSEESDSSAGSTFLRNTAEASKSLATEWERIERTLYDEDGEKCTRPQILEECRQWRQLHPQLRVIGKAVPIPEKRLSYRQIEHEEVIAMHYSNYEQFSESEDRLSQSSTDVTPQNSPRISLTSDIHEPKLSREKVSFKLHEEMDLPDTFCSLLHITPIQIRSPIYRKKTSQSIVRSDLASSKWMRKRPESSIYERNSAKSFVSLDTRNYLGVDNSKILNARVLTARHRDMARLEPLYTPESQNEVSKLGNGMQHYHIRKVSLPPLLLEEEKRKVTVGSARKFNKSRKPTSKIYSEKAKH
ncbi:uncharacterized protein LOC120626573 [Pararge aegeria]|uniref:Jg16237 protein n=2 Tax=Pararge aegeria TaxID=116150 RepID=A0A8S4RW74_9NEOP|nr:uncharacterized protein LOC120626573 [Pararge aegeria]CAH2241848.1 jg16237 [Pararge aegeria aegeria]